MDWSTLYVVISENWRAGTVSTFGRFTYSAEANHGELVASMTKEVNTLATGGFTGEDSEERERKLRSLLPSLVTSIFGTRRCVLNTLRNDLSD
jgi:hypothetical protein